jgi:hypothetical protein
MFPSLVMLSPPATLELTISKTLLRIAKPPEEAMATGATKALFRRLTSWFECAPPVNDTETPPYCIEFVPSMRS